MDVWIITDVRVVDVKQEGLFSRSISEVRLDRIQDISSNTSGFFQTFLKYGNVTVQTASENNKLFFEEIPRPDHVRDVLVDLTHKDTVKSQSLRT